MIKPHVTKHKSKRLRKKLHVGEFKELCFLVLGRYKPMVTVQDMFDDPDHYIEFLLENNLTTLSYHDNKWFNSFVYSKQTGGELNQSSKEVVSRWIQNNPLIDQESVVITDIFDSFYGPYPKEMAE